MYDGSHLPAVSTIPAAPQLNELQRQRHEELIGLLREYDGNVTAVARSLGKRRTHVQRWLKRLQIDPLAVYGTLCV